MRRWLPVLALALVVAGLMALADNREIGRPTIRSAGSSGYRAAFLYLEARGRPVSGWETSFGELAEPGTLILALPSVVPVTASDVAALARWIRAGGHLVFLPSGLDRIPSAQPLLDYLRLAEIQDGTGSPSAWSEWRAWTVDRMRLTGEEGALEIDPPTRVTLCPNDAQVRFVSTDGSPRVCTWGIGAGRVTLVNDASVWSNDRIASADNLGLLDDLAAGPGPVWFDEVHQGFGAAPVGPDLGAAPGALLAHAGLLYVALAWAFSRPVGPPLRGLGGASSSMLRELGVLGELHVAGRHARDAGERLLGLARGRLRRRCVEAHLPEHFTGDEAALLALARRIGTIEKEGTDGRGR